MTDRHGEIRFAIAQTDGPATQVLYMPPESDAWETLISFNYDEPGFTPVSISGDGRTAYVASNVGLDGKRRDKAGLYS